MPLIPWLPSLLFNHIPEMFGKFQTPATDCFMANINTSKQKLLFYVSVTVVESMIVPYRLIDYRYWKSVTFWAEG
jgi:hypothetical protein